MFPDVTVRFSVQVGPYDFEVEPRLGPDKRPAGRSFSTMRGRIEIVSDGQPLATPEDELASLVLGLCFDAVVQIGRTGHAVVALIDSYGYVRLDFEGDWVRFSGDRLPDLRLAARPFLEGLVECGSRFREWLRANADEDLSRLDADLAEADTDARRTLAQLPR